MSAKLVQGLPSGPFGLEYRSVRRQVFFFFFWGQRADSAASVSSFSHARLVEESASSRTADRWRLANRRDERGHEFRHPIGVLGGRVILLCG